MSNASPREHTRLLKLHTLRPEQLIVPSDFQYDPQFLKLHQQVEGGSVIVALTRLPVTGITTGFFRHQGGSVLHVTNLKSNWIEPVVGQIRGGLRPTLTVYWSPMCSEESKFVCPDDEAALAAYQELGITHAPCLIYRPAYVRRPEGAVWARNSGGLPTFFRAIASQNVQFPSFRSDPDEPVPQVLSSLRAACFATRARVRNFHKPLPDLPDYHQMLHALLLRHERVLESIEILMAAGRMEHALALVRMAYEAYLSFYIDWLSPLFFGPRLQLISAVDGLPRRAEPKAVQKAKNARRVLRGFDQLLGSVVEKARISSLGEAFYKIAYHDLSLIAHQAYGVLSAEALGFDDVEPKDSKAFTRTSIVWLSVITAAMIDCILKDTGEVAAT